MEEYNGLQCAITENNIRIYDSYTVTKKEKMIDTLNKIKADHPECNTFKRNMDDLLCE